MALQGAMAFSRKRHTHPGEVLTVVRLLAALPTVYRGHSGLAK